MRNRSSVLLAITGTCIAHAALASSGASAAADTLKLAEPEQRVSELRRWYDSVTDDCGGPDKPGYLCSGIALRTTASSVGFLPWDPSDSQLEKGSVAFSWLRRDSNFGKPFGNQNGLILYPPQAAPEGKIATLNVLCTFPINANTNQRPTLQGCGPIRGYEDTTATCQALGIDTPRQWLDKYPEAGNYRVCGWDLRAGAQQSAHLFETARQARDGLADVLWSVNNEVLLPVWEKGDGGRLPVHSFFYVDGERDALAKAQYDQIRYQQRYEQQVPVVRMTFPADKAGSATFAFAEQDQAVGRPTPTPSIDFEALATGQAARVTANGVEFRLSQRDRGVSDTPREGSGGLISGKHLAADVGIQFVLEGAGRRLVKFSWACNSYCSVQTAIAGETDELSEDGPGALRYGTKELIIDGPEIVVLSVDSEEDDSLLLLDNLSVRELPAK